MTALLDWSYDLLTGAERGGVQAPIVLRRHLRPRRRRGRRRRPVPSTPYDVPELVWSLADKSLVTVEPSANANRYRMPETVRAYAALRLAATGDAGANRGPPGRLVPRSSACPLSSRGNRALLAGGGRRARHLRLALISGLDPARDAVGPVAGPPASRTAGRAGQPRLGCDEIDAVLARATAPVGRDRPPPAAVGQPAGRRRRVWTRRGVCCIEGEAYGRHQRRVPTGGGCVRVGSPRVTLLLRNARLRPSTRLGGWRRSRSPPPRRMPTGPTPCCALRWWPAPAGDPDVACHQR